MAVTCQSAISFLDYDMRCTRHPDHGDMHRNGQVSWDADAPCCFATLRISPPGRLDHEGFLLTCGLPVGHEGWHSDGHGRWETTAAVQPV